MLSPHSIFLEQDAVHYPLTQKILEKLPNLPVNIINKLDWKKIINNEISHDLYKHGKSIFYLKTNPENLLKICPGHSSKTLCCQLYTLDFIENCPLDCHYCILQAYLNNPFCVITVNLDEQLQKIKQSLEKQSQLFFRITTGETSDGLALDQIVNFNTTLIQTFAKIPNACLELKTKMDNLDHLLDLDHRKGTVISWSVNPNRIINKYEIGAVSLERRLIAAEKAIAAGYLVAFHFDPIIHYEQWQVEYTETVKQIFNRIPENKIMWISLSTLRFPPLLQKIVQQRFPISNLMLNEFIFSNDGKMRYFKTIREKLISTMVKLVKQFAPELPLYLCMEKNYLWEKCMITHPSSSKNLEKLIATRIQKERNNS